MRPQEVAAMVPRPPPGCRGRRLVLEPGGKATTRGTPSARAIASAVATVGSARPFFTWFTCGEGGVGPAALGEQVCHGVPRHVDFPVGLEIHGLIGFRGDEGSRGRRPGGRVRRRRVPRPRDAGWRPVTAAERGDVGEGACAARAPPRRCRGAPALPADCSRRPRGGGAACAYHGGAGGHAQGEPPGR